MSVLETVGRTPLVELLNLNPRRPEVRILAKLEGNNPGGSVKDRPALAMILAAEQSGDLTPERTILEPTSGNTGIALAMIGAAKGYRVKLCMPQCVSVERQRILEALGADVVLTPAGLGTDGAIHEAHRLLEAEPDRYYMPNQFANCYNVHAHYESTGPEIFAQTGGQIDAFVAGMGTTGTLMGVGRFLKERDCGVRIVGVEPPVGHRIQGLKNMVESMRPAIYDQSMLDEIVTVGDEEAFDLTRRLATQEGIFVGMSSGAAVAGAIRVADQMRSGVVVALLPDRGDRYLSTTLFTPICAKCPP